MTARQNGADTVFKASVGFAALALLLLGSVAMQASAQEASAGLPPARGQSSQLLLFGAVTFAGTVSALLWMLVRSKRARDRAESRLHEMASRMPGAVCVFRESGTGIGTCEFLSANATQEFGVTREQATHDAGTILSQLPKEDRDHVTAALARSREDLSRFETDFRIRRRGAEVRWIHAVADPVREANGDLVWTGQWSDITDARRAEQTLRDATQRLEDAQTLAQLGNWSCDLATGKLAWSAQIYALLQRDPALGPLTLVETLALAGRNAEESADALIQAQELHEPRSFEVSVARAEGRPLRVQVIVQPVLSAQAKVMGLRGTVQDITARYVLERRLMEERDAADAANRAKSVFLATTSHEIRTPLSSMLGLLELVSLAPVDPETHTSLEAMRTSGKSLQRIVDDLLDFTKAEAGKVEIRLEATCVADVVEDVYRTHADSARKAGLEMRLQVDPEISAGLMLDALRLSQILGNFVRNAIKFTRQGSVEVRALLAAREGGRERIRFEVQDTGMGVPVEAQHALFEPFAQGERVAHTLGGSGLGLSIARRLAELMEGEVSMISAPGAGTMMVLEVTASLADPALTPAPRRNPATPAAIPALAHPAADPTGNGPLVLVVDDHPINRMVMQRQITALGHVAEDVASGAEALERWRTGRYSLVLTDCNMPGMSGYQLARQIREAETSLGRPRIPIIACSANAIAGVMQECIDSGMDDYLAKPTQLLTISEKLAKWLPSAEPPSGSARTAQPSTPVSGKAFNTVLQHDAQEPAGLAETGVTGRMLEKFRQVNDQDVSSLQEAIEQGDMAAIVRAAHRIKGACGFIGATGLASVCAMIEQSGRDEDGAAVAWLMDAFHRELEQLNADLDRR